MQQDDLDGALTGRGRAVGGREQEVATALLLTVGNRRPGATELLLGCAVRERPEAVELVDRRIAARDVAELGGTRREQRQRDPAGPVEAVIAAQPSRLREPAPRGLQAAGQPRAPPEAEREPDSTQRRADASRDRERR